jgi:hypothetical protein
VPLPDHAPSHPDLIALANAVQDAARASNVDQVHTSLCRLQNALRAHVHAERGHVAGLTPPARAVVIVGQSRLLRHVDRMLFDSVDTGDGCSCTGDALDLPRHLKWQAKLEHDLGIPPVSIRIGD